MKTFLSAITALSLLCAPAYAAPLTYLLPNKVDEQPVSAATPLPVTSGSGTGAPQTQGTSAAASADDGSNPIKIGCVSHTVAGLVSLAVLNDGARANAVCNRKGAVFLGAFTDDGGNQTTQLNAGIDAANNANGGIVVFPFNMGFNGVSWDRLRADGGAVRTSTVAAPTTTVASSGNVANASAVATLAATAAKTNYITGFQCTATGATVALAANLTVTGLAGGTLTYTFAFPVGVAVAATSLNVTFPNPVPASATNTAVVVTLPAGGVGNTNAACNAQGFQL